MSILRYASRDIVVDGVAFDGSLIEDISITQQAPDLIDGFAPPTRLTIKASNILKTFTNLFLTTDRRGSLVTVKRWDESVGGGSVVELTGRLTGYELGDTAILEVSVEPPDVLLTELPTGRITTTLFPNATDISFGIPVVFGNVKKLPLSYIFYDLTQNVYVYLVGYAGVTPTYLYRDGVLVDPADYTVYNGTYNNSVGAVGGDLRAYTVVVFRLRQVDFQGRMYDRTEGDRLTADVTGLAAERNFARAIRSVLSNTTWGLSQTIDATSFNAAEAVLTAIGGLYCDGWLLEPRLAKDALDELCMIRGMRLAQNTSGAWTISVDQPATAYAATFGFNDPFGYHNMVTAPVPKVQTATNNVTTLDVEYQYDTPTKKFLQLSAPRTVHPTGKPRRISLRFVRDQTTADQFVDYFGKRLFAIDNLMSVETGYEGIGLTLGQRVVLIAPDYGVFAPYEIHGITKHLSTVGLDVFRYDDRVYTYTPGALPADVIPDSAPDLSRTPPGAPSSLTSPLQGTDTSSAGIVTAWVDLSWVASATAAVSYLIQVRESGDSDWTTWDEKTVTTTRLRGLTPGLTYDYQVLARSQQNLLSLTGASLLAQLAPGDTTPPSAPTTIAVVAGTGKSVKIKITPAVPWSVVGAGAPATAASGNVTPALPTGWQVGDVFACVIATKDNVNATMPAGWTAIAAGTNNGTGLRTTMFYRRAVAGDTAPIVTHAAGSGILAVISAIRGLLPAGSPIDVAGTTKVNAASATVLSNAITTLADQAAVLFFGAVAAGSKTFSAYSGAPTPTEIVDTQANGLSLCLAAFAASPPGSTGARQCTASGAATVNNGLLVSLIPDQTGALDWAETWLYRNTTGTVPSGATLATPYLRGKKLEFTDVDVAYGTTYYYWAALRDTTGNQSALTPSSGHSATVAQVGTGDIGDGAVGGTQIGGGAVGTGNIGDGAVSGTSAISASDTITKTAFGEEDVPGMSIPAFTATGGDVLLLFNANPSLKNTYSAPQQVLLTLRVYQDGVAIPGSFAFWSPYSNMPAGEQMTIPIALIVPISGLSAATHSFKIRWDLETTLGSAQTSMAGRRMSVRELKR